MSKSGQRSQFLSRGAALITPQAGPRRAYQGTHQNNRMPAAFCQVAVVPEMTAGSTVSGTYRPLTCRQVLASHKHERQAQEKT